METPGKNDSNNFSAQEPTLREQIAIYLRHWPWFLIVVCISLTVAFLYLRYSTPFYQSTTSIIIKDSQGRGAASELAAFEDIGLISGMNSNSIENEIEILRSKRLLMNVVEILNLDIRYFIEGNFKSSELYGDKPFEVKILERYDNKSYLNYSVRFTIISATSFKITDEEQNTETEHNFGDRVDLPFGKITVIPHENLDSRLETGMATKVDVAFSDKFSVVSRYQNEIQITQVNKNASVIILNLNDPVREKAESILNELIVQFNQDAIDDRNLVARNTASFIEDRLQIITQELDSVESFKVDFKQENRLTDIESEAQLFLESASEFNKRQLAVATQLELVNNIITYLNNDTGVSLLPANLGITEGGMDNLIDNYNKLVLERNRMLRSSTEENPVVVNLNNQLRDLRQNVLTSLANVKNSLQVNLRDLRQQEATFGSKISQVPGQEKQFRGIERQQGIKEALYLFLLQKREETSISLAVTAPKAKIVDAAYSSRMPVSPKKNIVLLAGLLLGLLIPFLIIYLNQLLYDKVRSRKDLEREASSIPILGEIPKLSKNESELVSQNDRSILAESFRILRTNLQYLFVNQVHPKKGKTIFVTSTVKGEGKTFTAINLALTLANVGKRVVLIGADIRNPQLHRYITDSKHKKGVTDYLVSDKLDVNELLHPSDFNKNLSLLFSGSIPPNPAELWLSERTPNLFSTLADNFDYVIVDTAPSMLVTDTFLISKYADVTLYVVRADYTERKLLEFPVDSVAQKKLQGSAFVLNNVKMANFGYGNKYGYAYGVEKKSFFDKIKEVFK